RPLTDTSVSAAYADLAGVCEPSGTVRSYRGIIRAVNGTDGSNHTVNEVPVEQYLRSVIASEMSPAWAARGSQALQAQAIASRTYALAEKRYSYARTCDLTCQSYTGAATRTGVNGAFRRNEWPSTDTAVKATVGVVRRLGSASGQLAYTMFSSSSGGYSASNGLGFPVVADAGDATPTNPYHAWTATVAYTAINRAWPSIGTFTGITVSKRSGDGDWGGRVLTITVSGTAGSVTLTGDAFRRAVGMKSNWFSIRPESIPGGVDSSPPEPTTVPGTTTPVTTIPVTTVPAGPSCGNRVPPSIDGSSIATAGSMFTPTAPRRVVDTRDGTGTTATPLGTGCTLVVRPGVAAGATAVAVNLVTVNASANGYLTAYPCRRARPLTSAVQSLTGRVVSGSAIVPLAADGTFCIFTSAATDVVVDVFGAFAPDAGSQFEPIAAARLLDTRTSGRLVGAGQVVRIATRGTAKAGGDDTAVSLTVHALGGTGSGFVTMWPCDAPRPLASSLNITAGTPVSNAVEVATNTAGEVCAYSSTATHLMVDLQGWYGPSATTEFHAVVPYRLVDSRSAAGWNGMLNPGASKRVGVAGSGGVPASGVRAAVIAVTTVGPGRAGYLTGFACQATLPAVSMLRYPAGVNVAVSSTQMLSGTGDWCASASTSTNVVVDVNGWFG
ncbi:MAG: SpoIID/LytB domain-containing protein, partial [Actinomycetota bacterium]